VCCITDKLTGKAPPTATCNKKAEAAKRKAVYTKDQPLGPHNRESFDMGVIFSIHAEFYSTSSER